MGNSKFPLCIREKVYVYNSSKNLHWEFFGDWKEFE